METEKSQILFFFRKSNIEKGQQNTSAFKNFSKKTV